MNEAPMAVIPHSAGNGVFLAVKNAVFLLRIGGTLRSSVSTNGAALDAAGSGITGRP
jgi:hypothetical protein